MDKTDAAKKVIAFVVGGTTAKVVRSLIQQNVEPESKRDAAAITVGSYVLGGIAASAAKDYTDQMVDETIEWWKVNILGMKPQLEQE